MPSTCPRWNNPLAAHLKAGVVQLKNRDKSQTKERGRYLRGRKQGLWSTYSNAFLASN